MKDNKRKRLRRRKKSQKNKIEKRIQLIDDRAKISGPIRVNNQSQRVS